MLVIVCEAHTVGEKIFFLSFQHGEILEVTLVAPNRDKPCQEQGWPNLGGYSIGNPYPCLEVNWWWEIYSGFEFGLINQN